MVAPMDEDVVPGLIYPPPEIRNIIDKTATFVARNGPSFEERIRENERSNAKFCFLNPNDPYRGYYDHKVARVRDGKDDTGKKAVAAGQSQTSQVPETPAEPVREPPKEPEPFEFILETPTMSAQDLDIIKLTALFVARNGKQFMAKIALREAKNYQFDFLRPAHSLFAYFTRLVEQYTKILIPREGVKEKLERAVKDKFSTMEDVMSRVEYQAYHDEAQRMANEEAEEERVAFASVDWHDFVVVETIEFTDVDEKMRLPPPMSLKSLENMTLAQKRAAALFAGAIPEAQKEAGEKEADAMEVDDGEKTATATTTGRKIRTDYVPKVGKLPGVAEPTQICPRCGVAVKISEMEEHVRIELLDPKWREQKAVFDSRQKGSTLLVGADISKNLSRLSDIRTDIFGADGEAQKKKDDLDKLKEAGKSRVIWDGHAGSALAASQKAQTANVGSLVYEDDKTIGPQIPSLPLPPMPGMHFRPGMPQIPGMSGMPPMPGMPFMPPPPPGMVGVPRPPMLVPPPLPSTLAPPPLPPTLSGFAPPPLSSIPKNEPAMKKFKSDEAVGPDGLIPEDKFLAKYSVPVTLSIKLPEGGSMSLPNLPLSTTVSAVKEQLATQTGMAAGKQKLTTSGGLAMKNSVTLAYYNLISGSVLTLATKERGGRK